ncbi:hypothetical protein BU23DRAFT_238680 [Bimuria novae-zelandiae CBS 107.79]|uniref:Uncharacterized protein n=1 Tax=Bimuria novae-zelandiae CBS 107.79 TaxID=1447943 RepID=A0A6A5UY48_9PLEO|nr:hypothetical protein BU23DRAFT_238680 [Bimuria novae-zelandiae CBS 107.79]
MESEAPFPCKFDHRVMLDLAAKCPNLEKVYCSVSSNEWAPNFVSEAMNKTCRDYPGPRRDSRHGFGKPLLENDAPIPPGLRDVRLNFLCRPGWGFYSRTTDSPYQTSLNPRASTPSVPACVFSLSSYEKGICT